MSMDVMAWAPFAVRTTHEARQTDEDSFLIDRGFHNRGYHVIQGKLAQQFPTLFPGLDRSLIGADGSMFYRAAPMSSWEVRRANWSMLTDALAVHVFGAKDAGAARKQHADIEDPLFALVALGVPGGALIPGMVEKLAERLNDFTAPEAFSNPVVTRSVRPDYTLDAVKYQISQCAQEKGMVLFR